MRIPSGAAILTCLLMRALGFAEDSASVDFIRDIRPILSDKCFACHGPDASKRQAGLRLDQRESALAPTESGAVAIVPSDVEQSELVRRVMSDDADERMPPQEAKKTLTDEERQKLVAWVRSGAPYAAHWSFVAPQRPPLPAVIDDGWCRNPVDFFVLTRLEAQGLPPAPEASRETLIRRVSLDLTGLPPTPVEIDAFVGDQELNAYERVVDRLLDSPHYGERMAIDWLDAARFADTNGYHLDNGRDMTRWRAWVIDAFNRNLPFDQFTIEQLAGDLMPDASLEQRLASGFHRNHMINFEGGAIPEEYQTAYIVDRVNTTGTVWLGLSVGCAQCHDHKFDPISQREYYQLYAFFHHVPENGLDGNKGNAMPFVQLPSSEQKSRTESLDAEIHSLEQRLAQVETGNSTDNQATDKPSLEESLKRHREERAALELRIPTSMVMSDERVRETFVLVRGQYDQPGQPVTAGVPGSLPPLSPDMPANRLGLARWLVSPEQPLTARVTVNRYWQMLFGNGLVGTPEDFGSQGHLPSHPELLDWLACEFRRSTQAGAKGTSSQTWNIKSLLRLLVTSAAYRQDSRVSDVGRRQDPENNWLSRGPRFRLSAELIRDQALVVSGLLRHNVGGPSVSPYQPGDLWGELSSRADSANWTAQFFVQSHGEDLYRRSLYTFWKRTCPPAQMATFDAPDRETCTVKRARTNTPLQALILMNDPTYVEAARKLAERVFREAGADTDQRLRHAFRLVTARVPREGELAVLRGMLRRQHAIYANDPAAVEALLSVGESPVDEELDRKALAAWTMVASAILNLDETVTRN